MNIYFYDNYSSSYNRFGNRVSEKLVNMNNNIKIFYIHDNYDKGEVQLNNFIKDNVFVIPKRKVFDYIKAFPPHSFLCFSFRIPDVYWTTVFNIKGIPTFQVMHGIYVTKYKRTITYILKDIPRIISYTRYLYRLLLLSNNKRSLFVNMIKKDFSYESKSNKIDEITLSKNLILWGTRWKYWFIENFGYSEKCDYHVCGSFDFHLLNDEDNIIRSNENSITYISQTIAEDGRITNKVFEEFIDNLFAMAESMTDILYIKLHPRSNRRFYERFKELDNVVITRKFPISEIYISHYSALLTVPVYLRKKIVLVKFTNHPIPDEYSYMSSNIIDHYKPINIKEMSFETMNDYAEYFEYNKDPFMKVAQFVVG